MINKERFCQAFIDMHCKDDFSYEGLSELYDFLTMDEANGDMGMELDVVALACKYREESVYNALESYNLESIDELEEQTMIVWHDQENAIVLYQQF